MCESIEDGGGSTDCPCDVSRRFVLHVGQDKSSSIEGFGYILQEGFMQCAPYSLGHP